MDQNFLEIARILRIGKYLLELVKNLQSIGVVNTIIAFFVGCIVSYLISFTEWYQNNPFLVKIIIILFFPLLFITILNIVEIVSAIKTKHLRELYDQGYKTIKKFGVSVHDGTRYVIRLVRLLFVMVFFFGIITIRLRLRIEDFNGKIRTFKQIRAN